MALPKDSCWHNFPFDADLVMRKLGLRQKLSPQELLSFLGREAEKLGHTVWLAKRDARFSCVDPKPGQPRIIKYVKEQSQHALWCDGHWFFLSGARSWDEHLTRFHLHFCANSTLADREVFESEWMEWPQNHPFTASPRLEMLATAAKEWQRPQAPAHLRSRFERHTTATLNLPSDRHLMELELSRGLRFPLPPKEAWEALVFELHQRQWSIEAFEQIQVFPLDFEPRKKNGLNPNLNAQLVRTSYYADNGQAVLISSDTESPYFLKIQSAAHDWLLKHTLTAPLQPQPNPSLPPEEVDKVARWLLTLRLEEGLSQGQENGKPKVRL